MTALDQKDGQDGSHQHVREDVVRPVELRFEVASLREGLVPRAGVAKPNEESGAVSAQKA